MGPRVVLGRGFGAFIAGLNGIGTVWIFALMALINVDVFSRYLFKAPIQGVAELVEMSIVGIVFLQISDSIRRGRLTRSDGLYSRMAARHPAAGHVIGAIFDIAGALFFVAILAGAIPRLIEAIERGYFVGNEGLFVVPVWPIRLILVIGCVAASLQFLVLAWRHVHALSSDAVTSQ